jgi:hypothetical protein
MIVFALLSTGAIEICYGVDSGLTHHNSDTGSYRKFRILSKPTLLPYRCATFR